MKLTMISGDWGKGPVANPLVRRHVKYPDFKTLWAVTSLGAKQYPFRGHLA